MGSSRLCRYEYRLHDVASRIERPNIIGAQTAGSSRSHGYTSLFNTRYVPSQHVLSLTFYLRVFPSNHRKNRPRFDTMWRVSTAEVCLLSCHASRIERPNIIGAQNSAAHWQPPGLSRSHGYTSLFNTRYVPSQHVLSFTFYLRVFPSNHRKNWPRSNTRWRVSTAEVCLLSCHAYKIASKYSPCPTVHLLHRSTSLMMTPFSTSSISIGLFF